jgi:hypothetical protein
VSKLSKLGAVLISFDNVVIASADEVEVKAVSD